MQYGSHLYFHSCTIKLEDVERNIFINWCSLPKDPSHYTVDTTFEFKNLMLTIVEIAVIVSNKLQIEACYSV